METERILLEKGIRINEIISRLLYKTQAFSAIVIQGNGEVHEFEQIAPVIVADNPAILSVMLAPNGIVSHVYPLQENEDSIGWDLMAESPLNRAAAVSLSTGSLVFDGPIVLPQNKDALIGILPVIINTPEKYGFWGFIAITLKFPDVLDDVGLELLKTNGLSYELWRVNPQTNDRQVIIGDLNNVNRRSPIIETPLKILNATWYLDVQPTRTWYNDLGNLALMIAGLLICILVLVVMKNNYDLHRLKNFFEAMAKTDMVTGIYNRLHLEENIKPIISLLSRSGGFLSVLMIDVDFFKKYNDTYGHNKGDVCLRTIATILKQSLLRKEDFVIRYGGEEFIVVLPNTNERGACRVAERLLTRIRDYQIPHKSSEVADHITISIGITTSQAKHTHYGDDYIKRADTAMYMSKKGGRDRATFLNFDENV